MPTKENELIKDNVSLSIVETARKLLNSKEKSLTVRDILQEMKITNRVFYNRFHNIAEVLNILYQENAEKIRKSLNAVIDKKDDFIESVKNIASQAVILAYDRARNFSKMVFEADSESEHNMKWWLSEIKKLVHQGKDQGVLQKKLDEDTISYTIWCFIRGFNADALARKLSLEEALRCFQVGFGTFLEGMRVQPA